MEDAQKVIAKWMEFCLARSGLSAADWATKANLNPTTVSRAMKSNYGSVTSVKTLHALAGAMSMPSVLDFLSAQAIDRALPDITVELLISALPAVGCHIDEGQASRLTAAMLSARSIIARAEPGLQNSPAFRQAVLAAAIEESNH